MLFCLDNDRESNMKLLKFIDSVECFSPGPFRARRLRTPLRKNSAETSSLHPVSRAQATAIKRQWMASLDCVRIRDAARNPWSCTSVASQRSASSPRSCANASLSRDGVALFQQGFLMDPLVHYGFEAPWNKRFAHIPI